MTVAAKRLILLGVCAATLLGVAGFTVWRSTRRVVDARAFEFSPSPDHKSVDMNGVAIVKGYVLEIYPVGGAAPVQTIDLGKPDPSPDGVIRIEWSSIRMTPLAPGTTYEAAITAVGPYGRGGSGRSNRFAFSGGR